MILYKFQILHTVLWKLMFMLVMMAIPILVS